MTDVEKGTCASRFTPRGNRVNEHSPLETVDARSTGCGHHQSRCWPVPWPRLRPTIKNDKVLGEGGRMGSRECAQRARAVFLTKKKCSGCVKMGDRNVAQNSYLTTRGSVSHDTGWRISKHGVAYLKTRGSLSRKLTGGPGNEKVDRKNRRKSRPKKSTENFDEKIESNFPPFLNLKCASLCTDFFLTTTTQHKTRRTWQRTRCDKGACERGEGHKGTQGRGDTTGGNKDNGADNDERFTQTQMGKRCLIKHK